MQLDKFTDYGLRILMTLAVQAPDKISVARIAAIFGVSDNHLSKVATELVRAGYLISERGRGGGLRLAMKPEKISIGAVVRLLKSDAPVVECLGVDRSCRILPACGLRQPLRLAEEAFYSVLDDVTLADVIKKRTDLSELLTLNP